VTGTARRPDATEAAVVGTARATGEGAGFAEAATECAAKSVAGTSTGAETPVAGGPGPAGGAVPDEAVGFVEPEAADGAEAADDCCGAGAWPGDGVGSGLPTVSAGGNSDSGSR
jgi:hypothetical protein